MNVCYSLATVLQEIEPVLFRSSLSSIPQLTICPYRERDELRGVEGIVDRANGLRGVVGVGVTPGWVRIPVHLATYMLQRNV